MFVKPYCRPRSSDQFGRTGTENPAVQRARDVSTSCPKVNFARESLPPASSKLLLASASLRTDERLVRRARRTPHRRRTMKGVVFLGDRKLELREFPDPTPGPRDVILAIKASGMCGSDLHTYRAPANAG